MALDTLCACVALSTDMTNTEILNFASHDRIRECEDIISDSTCEQRCAAQIVQLALLALRDTVIRPNRPEIYNARIDKIRQLVFSVGAQPRGDVSAPPLRTYPAAYGELRPDCYIE